MEVTFETDNRDLHTTELLIMAGNVNTDNVHVELTIEVDPFELMENAIENYDNSMVMNLWTLFKANLERLTDENLWDDFKTRMDQYTETEP